MQKNDSVLYCAFERLTDIAKLEWLPSVNSNMGSYNSMPHLLNIENILSDILQNTPCGKTFSINTIECYVLLCSIWLHDIDKGKGSDTGEGKRKHGKKSREMVLTIGRS